MQMGSRFWIGIVFYISILVAATSCNRKLPDSPPMAESDTIAPAVQESAQHTELAGEFAEFLDKFSNDSTYQKEHVVFPLKFTHAGYAGEKDSVFTVSQRDYAIVDLANPQPDDFGNAVNTSASMPNETMVIVTITGKEVGIHIAFYFFRESDSWILKEVIDSST